MSISQTLDRHWKLALAISVGLALYFYFTRVRVVGVVDASGEGMTVNGR